MRSRLKEYAVPALVAVIAALVVASAWLWRWQVNAETRADRGVSGSAGWFDIGVNQAVLFLDRAEQYLDSGEQTTAAAQILEAEFALAEARTGGAIYSVASGVGGQFRIVNVIGLYASELMVLRFGLQQDGGLEADGRRLLRDIAGDLRAIDGATPREMLLRAHPGELQRAMEGLRDALKVSTARGLLGFDAGATPPAATRSP